MNFGSLAGKLLGSITSKPVVWGAVILMTVLLGKIALLKMEVRREHDARVTAETVIVNQEAAADSTRLVYEDSLTRTFERLNTHIAELRDSLSGVVVSSEVTLRSDTATGDTPPVVATIDSLVFADYVEPIHLDAVVRLLPDPNLIWRAVIDPVEIGFRIACVEREGSVAAAVTNVVTPRWLRATFATVQDVGVCNPRLTIPEQRTGLPWYLPVATAAAGALAGAALADDWQRGALAGAAIGGGFGFVLHGVF